MVLRTDTGTYLPSPASISPPPAGGSFVDGLSGVKITRLTDERDGAGFGTTYSIWPTANRDSTRLWIYSSASNSYWIAVFDPVTGNRVGPLQPVSPASGRHFVNNESALWSDLDSDKLFIFVDAKLCFYRPSTKAYTVVKDLTSQLGADYYFLQQHKSRDDKRFAASGPFGFMVYDVGQDRILLDVRTTDLNGIALDRTGKWLLYVPENDLIEYVYNVETGTREQLTSDPRTGLPDFTIGHLDVGSDLVAGNDQWRGAISVRKFSSPHVAPAAFVYSPFWFSHHLSMTADDENWALLSTYGDVVGPKDPITGLYLDPNKFKDECFEVGIQGADAGKIRRLFHHRASFTDPDFSKRYWGTPKANKSRDGRFAWFTSNMGGLSNHLYVADLATVGITPTPVPAPTPSPTPTPAPQPVRTPSPDNTKGPSIIDSQGALWTLGLELQTLKDATHVGRGAGSVYKYVSPVVYVLATDNKTWYAWSGSQWTEHGTTEPGGAVTPTPTPTPTPAPAPTPTPAPAPIPLIRKLAQPTTEAKWNTLLTQQKAEGFYLTKFLTGAWVEFKKVI